MTKKDGKYSFKSILPVPYKADPNSEASWRPAHIHMRVSVPGQQDLVTQIYFKGGKYVDKDEWASAPEAVNRILDIRSGQNGESEITFNVVLKKEYALEPKVYDRITGLYDMGRDKFIEFVKRDDALHMKSNGQLMSALSYIGNNSFREGTRFTKASFEFLKDGSVQVTVEDEGKTSKGTKYLKY